MKAWDWLKLPIINYEPGKKNPGTDTRYGVICKVVESSSQIAEE
jgi:hypothetical protein